MRTKEEIIAYIDYLKHERKLAEVYGDFWLLNDYKAYKSALAGEYISAVGTLKRCADKAQRLHSGSIGHRKAKAKARETRRKLQELEVMLDKPIEDYKPKHPLYLKPSKKYIYTEPETVEKILAGSTYTFLSFMPGFNVK